MRLTGKVGMVAAVFALAFAPPAAGVGETHEDWDWMRCIGSDGINFGCQAVIRAAVEVVSCDDRNCTLAVNATLVGGANLPGLHQSHVYVIGGDEGAAVCVGVPQVREAAGDLLPCGGVCDGHDVGHQGGCHGSITFNLTMPPDGSWRWFTVNGLYAWNTYGGQADPAVWFDLWRHEDGTIDISSFGENTLYHPQPTA